MQRWKRGNATAGVSIVWTLQCFAVGAAWTAWILLQLLECRRVAREVQFPSACSQAPQASHWPVWVSRRMGSTLVTPQLPVPIGRRHADPTSPPLCWSKGLAGPDDDILHKVPSQVLHFPRSHRIGDMGIPLLQLFHPAHARISSAERAPLASTRRRPRTNP